MVVREGLVAALCERRLYEANKEALQHALATVTDRRYNAAATDRRYNELAGWGLGEAFEQFVDGTAGFEEIGNIDFLLATIRSNQNNLAAKQGGGIGLAEVQTLEQLAEVAVGFHQVADVEFAAAAVRRDQRDFTA